MNLPGRFSQFSERKPQQAPALFVAFPRRFRPQNGPSAEKNPKKPGKMRKSAKKTGVRPSNSYKLVSRTDPQYSRFDRI
jgi:hypothetical protein